MTKYKFNELPDWARDDLYTRSYNRERPTRYMVTLHGETRPRRVYAAPIGNVAVFYLKSQGHTIYYEPALDSALHSRETV